MSSSQYASAAALAGARRKGGLWARAWPWLRVGIALLPTFVAAGYYGLIASDRYVSEARFVIHTASKPAGLLGGLSALLQLAGLERSQDDAYAVRDYINSRDAMTALAQRIDLRGVYNDPRADLLARFPSVLYGKSDEEFYRYFQSMETVFVNNTSGLTILRVEAFRPQDAHQIALGLLELGEAMVNRLNDRIQQDSLALARGELARAEERKIATAVAITAFRNQAVMLDPNKETAALIGLIGQLSAQRAQARMLLDETRANSPGSPQLQSQQQRIAAIDRQIEEQRAKIIGDATGLVEKIAQYERLELEDQFALRALAQATASLEAARLEARRQQLFLERVVEPGLPDDAVMPQRLRVIGTVFGFNVLGALVLFLIISSAKEHVAGARHLQ